MTFSIVVAVDGDDGIAKDGAIPWDVPEDRRLFRYITCYIPRPGLRNCVIMGRKTFESMGSKPLKGRLNVVLSRSSQPQYTVPDVVWCASLDKALEHASGQADINATYVIGGEQLYKEALGRDDWDLMYCTTIDGTYNCDQFVDTKGHLPLNWVHPGDPAGVTFDVYMRQWSRRPKTPDNYPSINSNYGEYTYLTLVRSLVKKSVAGDSRSDRTQVGTYSMFGPQLTFDLRVGFPLLTCKRVPFKMVLKELLFFLSGSTDATKLAAQNVHIWDDNTTREFLDNRGLVYADGTPYAVGDMGPMYGFQWRHAGAEYRGCKAVYTGQGVDQIAQITELLKTDPYSRRIILSAHSVADLDQMALHPCHSMFQLYVSNGELSGKLTQRSADIFLGVPFNIASYALLIHMFARVAGLRVGKLVMSFGDVHLYKSHLDAVSKLPSSHFMPYPKLVIHGTQETMDDFKLKDFEILNYVPGPTIRAPMAV